MKTKTALLTLIMAGAASPALSHGTHLKTTHIEAGHFELHNIMGFSSDKKDGDSFDNEVELSYSFTDRFKLELSLSSENHENEPADWVSAVGVAAQFAVLTEGECTPGMHLYLGYEFNREHNSPGPDSLELVAIFEKNYGKFNGLLNLKFAKEIGDHAEGGVEFSLAARPSYSITEHFAAGIEYFADFHQIDSMPRYSEQSHQIGPVVMFSPFHDAHASLAWLGGISGDAPDSTVKFELGLEF